MQMYPSGSGKKAYYNLVEEEYPKNNFPVFAMKCGDECISPPKITYLNNYENYDNYGHTKHGHEDHNHGGWGGNNGYPGHGGDYKGYAAQYSSSAYTIGGVGGGYGHHYEPYQSMGGRQQGFPLWNSKGIRD